jgi:hypothetical protein
MWYAICSNPLGVSAKSPQLSLGYFPAGPHLSGAGAEARRLLQFADLAVLQAAQLEGYRDNFALSTLPLIDLFLQDKSRWKLSK